MSSRTGRRRQNERLARLTALPDAERSRKAEQLLMEWSNEVRYLAWHAGAGAARNFVDNPNRIASARLLDPTGIIEAKLRRVLTDAEAEATGHRISLGGNRC